MVGASVADNAEMDRGWGKWGEKGGLDVRQLQAI